MSKYATEKSRWLGPALGAGFGTAAVASGFGELAPAGRKFGGWLGNVIKTATGFGEYEVRANSLYEGSQVPFVANRPTINGTTISHREYIMDVRTAVSPGDFRSYQFDINPGLGNTFEWLSQIAVNYEEYVIEGCLFVFRSMSADALNSTNTALGSVMMATQYNTYQTPFANKAEMENHAYSMSCKPSEDMIHPIECDPHQSSITTFFVRGASPPTGADRRLYDLGRFEIGTTGFQGSDVNIGELHVTYQVSLMKPRLYAALGQSILFYHVAAQAGTWTQTSPLGPYPLVTTSSTNMDITVFAQGQPGGPTTLTFIMPPLASPLFFTLEYYVDLGSGNANTEAPSVSSLQNATDYTAGYFPRVQSGVYPSPATGSNSRNKSVIKAFKCAGGYQQTEVELEIPFWSLPSTVGRADFYIKQLPYKGAS